MPYNFPEEVWIGNRKLVTTRIEMPLWCTSEVIKELFAKRPVIHIGGFKVKYKEKDFEDVVADMTAVEWIEKKYQHIDTDKILPLVQKDIPVDGEEILEWMHHAFSANAAISVMQTNAMEVGSYVEGNCDDAYVPGVQVQDISYVSEPSNKITERGYAQLRSPYGIDRVPILDKLTVIKDKMLAWSAIPWVGLKQWAGALLKWVKLAANPFKGHLPNINIGGLSSPQFFAHIPPHFGFKNIVELAIASNKNQRLVLTYRDPRNFTRDYFRVVIPLRANCIAKVRYKIRSLFGVPPFLVQAEAPDNGLFDVQYYNVKSSLIPF